MVVQTRFLQQNDLNSFSISISYLNPDVKAPIIALRSSNMLAQHLWKSYRQCISKNSFKGGILSRLRLLNYEPRKSNGFSSGLFIKNIFNFRPRHAYHDPDVQTNIHFYMMVNILGLKIGSFERFIIPKYTKITKTRKQVLYMMRQSAG